MANLSVAEIYPLVKVKGEKDFEAAGYVSREFMEALADTSFRGGGYVSQLEDETPLRAFVNGRYSMQSTYEYMVEYNWEEYQNLRKVALKNNIQQVKIWYVDEESGFDLFGYGYTTIDFEINKILKQRFTEELPVYSESEVYNKMHAIVDKLYIDNDIDQAIKDVKLYNENLKEETDEYGSYKLPIELFYDDDDDNEIIDIEDIEDRISDWGYQARAYISTYIFENCVD